MQETIKIFIHQLKDGVKEDQLQYDAGVIHEMDGQYVIGYEQYGASETFSVGQGIYDKDGNLMGYLGVGLYNNLDCSASYKDPSLRVPAEVWCVYMPTKYCKPGNKVYTYWQNEQRKKENANG